MCAGQPAIEGQQCGVERLGESNVERVPAAKGAAQIPGAIHDPAMAEPLTRPIAEVGNGLPSGRRVHVTPQMLSADHSENFDVNHMRCGVVGIRGEPIGDLSRARGVSHHLEKT